MEHLKIEKITAFVAIDEDGNEGVMGFRNGNQWIPMVCGDTERMQSLYPVAVQISQLSGKDFRIIQFSNREDITDSFVK